MSRHTSLAAALVLIAFTVLAPGRAAPAATFGMTPNHVVGLWTNINDCLVAVADRLAADDGLRAEVDAMQPARFQGKKPADVLAKVAEFRTKLDELRASSGLGATRIYGTKGENITPSHVFLNSGYVLNSLVSWVIANTGPEQLVSPFYKRYEFSGKTPSDAFSMVDLANRRLGAILARTAG